MNTYEKSLPGKIAKAAKRAEQAKSALEHICDTKARRYWEYELQCAEADLTHLQQACADMGIA
jgi:hypothetical protein